MRDSLGFSLVVRELLYQSGWSFKIVSAHPRVDRQFKLNSFGLKG